MCLDGDHARECDAACAACVRHKARFPRASRVSDDVYERQGVRLGVQVARVPRGALIRSDCCGLQNRREGVREEGGKEGGRHDHGLALVEPARGWSRFRDRRMQGSARFSHATRTGSIGLSPLGKWLRVTSIHGDDGGDIRPMPDEVRSGGRVL